MSHLRLAAFMVRSFFFFFLICICDFSRVLQHYQACQVDHDIIFLTNKIECFTDL